MGENKKYLKPPPSFKVALGNGDSLEPVSSVSSPSVYFFAQASTLGKVSSGFKSHFVATTAQGLKAISKEKASKKARSFCPVFGVNLSLFVAF